MKKFFNNRVLPYILMLTIRLWCLTLRIRNLNPDMEREIREKPGRAIYTFWHSQLFYLFYRFRGLDKYTLLISPSKDGDLLANMVKLFGYSVVRGSSFKNTVPGTRECIQLLKQDEKIVVIADGSRGPRHIAQAGSLQLARITGASVYTLAYNAATQYQFPSWDRFVLPLPFTKVTLNFGEPITVPKGADKEIIRQKQDELTDRLNQITRECQQK